MLLKRLRKKMQGRRTHVGRSEYASMSLSSMSVSSPLASTGSGLGWVKKAWDFYDVVPEMRLVVDYRAAALSKVKIRVGVMTEDGPEVITDSRSELILDQLFGGQMYHSEGMSRYAQHLTIIGDTYTFVVNNNGQDQWLIVPADHVNFTASRVSFTNPMDGVNVEYDTASIYNHRLWQAHPHNAWEADCPTRGAISTLDTIHHMNASIRSMAKSRLIGAGILPIPLEANLPQPTGDDANLSPLDGFTKLLGQVASRAIQNPNDASAHVPILLGMPAEAIKSLMQKPISFWSEFDENVADLRDTEIRRYAAGQPLPTEMITGYQDVNHWTGWHLSEEDLKFDIAPLTETILDALTVRIVQPLHGPKFVLIPDYSDIVTRPNRLPEAIELHAAGVLTNDEVREIAGFPPLDDSLARDAKQKQDDNVMQVPSQRTNPPEELDRTRDQDTQYAVATLVARDLLYTAGQWLLTHSGRGARKEIAAVAAVDRHVQFAADSGVHAEAVTRVRPKYDGVVDDALFGKVSSYVGHIIEGRKRFDDAELRSWVSNG